MSIPDTTQMNADILALMPDNVTGLISPADARNANSIIIDNLVVGSSFLTIRTITADPTFTDADYHFKVDATSGVVTVTLPTTNITNRIFVFTKSDGMSNNVTIDGNGNNINGAATQILVSQYESITIHFDGTDWSIS